MHTWPGGGGRGAEAQFVLSVCIVYGDIDVVLQWQFELAQWQEDLHGPLAPSNRPVAPQSGYHYIMTLWS